MSVETMPETKEVPLSEIRIDGGTQMRVELDQDTIADYREQMLAGRRFPPIKLFYDGSNYWPGDGFHRYFARRKAGLETIEAEVTPGTQRDAILYAAGANAEHGKSRTAADKRRAVTLLLQDEEWSQWPQAKIAEACGVSREFVSRVNSELKPASCDRSQDAPPATRTVTRGGKTYQQNVANIGRKKEPEPTAPAESPKPAAMVDNQDDPDQVTIEQFLNKFPDPSREKFDKVLEEWKQLVRNVFWEKVFESLTPNRATAVLGLQLSEYGSIDGNDDAANEKLAIEHADLLELAKDADGAGLRDLMALALNEQTLESLVQFPNAGLVGARTCAVLANWWGAKLPPEPKLDQFQKNTAPADSAAGDAEMSSDDRNLMKALHSFAGAKERWTERKAKGMDDAALKQAIGDEFGISGGAAGPGYCYSAKGGVAPAIWLGKAASQGKPSLSGKALVNRVRCLLMIPGPDQSVARGTEPRAASVPDKPAGQSLNWHQWARGVEKSCNTLKLDVGKVFPVGLALSLYKEGLKPREAAKRYAELQGGKTATVSPGQEATQGERPRPKDDEYTLAELGMSYDVLKRVLQPSRPEPTRATKAKPAEPGRLPVVFVRGWPFWCYAWAYTGTANTETEYASLRPLYTEAEWGDRPKSMHWTDLRQDYLTGVICCDANKTRYVIGPTDERIDVLVKDLPIEDPEHPAGQATDGAADNDAGAAGFDDPAIFNAEDLELSLKAIEKADAVELLKTHNKMYAQIPTLEYDGQCWVVLGTTRVRGVECWRLAVLGPGGKDDLARSDANAAAELGNFDGIGVVDLNDSKKRKRVCCLEGKYPAQVVYVRA